MPKQLELADDGRVIIRTKTKAGEQEWVLRRPTLGEYRQLVEMAQAADLKLRSAIDAVEDVDEKIRVSGSLQIGSGEPAIYGALVREFIVMLAEGDPPDVDDLPSWAASGQASTRMIGHWRAVPLDLGPSVAAP